MINIEQCQQKLNIINLLNVVFMAERLNRNAIDYPAVPNKVATDCNPSTNYPVTMMDHTSHASTNRFSLCLMIPGTTKHPKI